MSSSEPRTRPDAGAVRTVPSALFVTTVPITLEAFLLPFADHFRAQGWRVDALANGATSNPHLDGHFGERFDVAWSRTPLASSTHRSARRHLHLPRLPLLPRTVSRAARLLQDDGAHRRSMDRLPRHSQSRGPRGRSRARRYRARPGPLHPRHRGRLRAVRTRHRIRRGDGARPYRAWGRLTAQRALSRHHGR